MSATSTPPGSANWSAALPPFERRRQMKPLKLTKRIQDLLQITKLYTIFEVFDDEAAGLAKSN